MSWSNNTSELDEGSTNATLFAFPPLAIISCATVGLPLNLLIAIVIVGQERLHKPRHICWLGVTISNLFALLVSLNELVVFHILPEHRPSCWIFALSVGIPYATLLFNLLVGLIDRFVAITYPLWHKNQVTVRWIVFAQLTGFVCLSLLFKTFYFVDGKITEIDCQNDHLHGRTIVITLMILILLCIVAQVVVYVKTKSHYVSQRESQSMTRMGSLNSVHRLHPFNMTLESSGIRSPNVTPNQRNEAEYFVHIGTETISRLEVEAAWTLIQGVTSLLVISSPIFLVSLGAVYCGRVYNDCTTVTWMIPFFRELVLVHTVYNPVMYIWRSHEFRLAVKRKCCLMPRRN